MVRRARRALRPVRRVWRRMTAPARDWIRIRIELARTPPPTTFNEKVRYRMLADRSPLLTTFADKLASRDYVESRVGAHVLSELYLVTDRPAVLVETALPREFVVKPTHASGAGILVAEFGPVDKELPEPAGNWKLALVHPDRVRRDRLVETGEGWMSRGFSSREWGYRNVPRRVLVEELLEEDGRVAFDYKFFVFHGRVRMVEVDLDRFQGHTRTLYTPEWERIEAEYGYLAGADVEPPRPLPEMLRISEALGVETDFVRVDLYCPGDRIVFGEFTTYPMRGEGEFKPSDVDRWLGSWWTQPRRSK
jgi:hypothetical protein